MAKIEENKNCYVSTEQRNILLKLATFPTIEEYFFLTGGTCLAVFYLHHRISDDLDLFTYVPLDLSEIDFWIKTVWGTRETPFLSELLWQW